MIEITDRCPVDVRVTSVNPSYGLVYLRFSFEELTAMYFVADVALVTPLRDGMNLVAKEYVATKVNNPGVLVLSEMAGAAVELADAIQINPNDTDQIADAIFTALQMPYEEQAKRISKMQVILSVQTVNKWAVDFMEEWKNVVDKNHTSWDCFDV